MIQCTKCTSHNWDNRITWSSVRNEQTLPRFAGVQNRTRAFFAMSAAGVHPKNQNRVLTTVNSLHIVLNEMMC